MTKQQILRMLRERPIEVGHWVGLKDLTDLNNEWLVSFLCGRKDMTLQAHRNSYKTSTLSVALALYPLIFPRRTLMYFRKTDTDVSDVSRRAAAIIKSGCMQRISKELYGRPVRILRESSGEIQTDLAPAINGTSQITGLGIGTSITGKHADTIITDDIVNLKDRVSRAEREQTKRIYQELHNVVNRGGRIINIGTPWHKDDAFTLMPEPAKYDCYSTGLITPAQLDALREQMSPSLFACNYELRHIADKDALFPEAHYTDEEKGIYDGIAHIDAAYGGEDYTAFTVCKSTPAGFVMFGKLWQKHVDDCMEEIETLHEKYKAGTIYVETNGDKGYLRKELLSKRLPVVGYHESMNKHLKICTYLRKSWPQIEWLRDSDPEYMAQILDYTEQAAHDDAPDSAASILRQTVTQRRMNHVHGGL